MFEKNGSRTWDVVYDRLYEKEHEKNNIEKMVKKGNTYIPVRKGESEKDVLKDYNSRNNEKTLETIKEKQHDEEMRQRGVKTSLGEKGNKEVEASQSRRGKLIEFTQNNKDKIDEWAKDYDEKAVSEKISQGKKLKAKEYFGFLAQKPKEGDVVLAGGKNGEDIKIGSEKQNSNRSEISRGTVPEKSTLNTMVEKNGDIAEKIIEDDEWNDIRVTRYGNGHTVIENERTGRRMKITPSDTKESLNKKIEDSYKETSNQPYKKAFEDYKKKHPNTKLDLDDFIKISEGK